jgi:hypothetical protein
MSTFQRCLTAESLHRVEGWKSQLQAWQDRAGNCIELRPNETVTFYRHGQSALELQFLGSRVKARTFGTRGTTDLQGDDLGTLLEAATSTISSWMAERSSQEPWEIAQQAALIHTLRTPQAELVAIDQQLAIPAADLRAPGFERHRVDLVVLDRTTGDLWLLELKLATSPELDGLFLKQLAKTRALPGAFSGGEAGLSRHYQRLLAQKGQLGLLPEGLPALSGRIQTAGLVLGSDAAAAARIACWDAIPEGLQDVRMAVCPPGEVPALHTFRPLQDLQKWSLAAARDAYAPRHPRHNSFTVEEDQQQAHWSTRAELSDAHLGPHASAILAQLKAHGVSPHSELDHPRSSQAACLQLFASACWGSDVAKQAWARALTNLIGAPGLELEEVTACEFEVPHGRQCRKLQRSCAVQGGSNLVGERKGGTRLDVWLELKGRRSGKEVRFGVGVEFKYTEPEFGTCGGFLSDGFTETGRKACLGEIPGRVEQCYLLHAEGRHYLRDRSWFEKEPLADGNPCLLLGPVNQLYRAHFLTAAFAQARALGDAHFFLVIHDGRNLELRAPERRLPAQPPFAEGPIERYREALVPSRRSTFGVATTQEILAVLTHHAPDEPSLQALRTRYGW